MPVVTTISIALNKPATLGKSFISNPPDSSVCAKNYRVYIFICDEDEYIQAFVIPTNSLNDRNYAYKHLKMH